MDRDRFRKGDQLVTLAPTFAPRHRDLIPAGTTGTVLRGGRFNAQVEWNSPDIDGNPTTLAAELPYPTARVVRAQEA